MLDGLLLRGAAKGLSLYIGAHMRNGSVWISGWTRLSSSFKKVMWMIEGHTLVLWLPMSHNISSKCLSEYEHVLSHICLGNSLFCLKGSHRNGIFKYWENSIKKYRESEKLIIKATLRINQMWPTLWKIFTFNRKELLKEVLVLTLEGG